MDIYSKLSQIQSRRLSCDSDFDQENSGILEVNYSREISKDDSYLIHSSQRNYLDQDDLIEKKEVEEEIAEIIDGHLNYNSNSHSFLFSEQSNFKQDHNLRKEDSEPLLKIDSLSISV